MDIDLLNELLQEKQTPTPAPKQEQSGVSMEILQRLKDLMTDSTPSTTRKAKQRISKAQREALAKARQARKLRYIERHQFDREKSINVVKKQNEVIEEAPDTITLTKNELEELVSTKLKQFITEQQEEEDTDVPAYQAPKTIYQQPPPPPQAKPAPVVNPIDRYGYRMMKATDNIPCGAGKGAPPPDNEAIQLQPINPMSLLKSRFRGLS